MQVSGLDSFADTHLRIHHYIDVQDRATYFPKKPFP